MTATDRAAHLYVIGKLATYFLAFCCGVAATVCVQAVFA